MAIATVVTRGYGTFGDVSLLPTRGYSVNLIASGGQNNTPSYFQQAGQCSAMMSQGSMLAGSFIQGSAFPSSFEQGGYQSESFEQGSRAPNWFVQE